MADPAWTSFRQHVLEDPALAASLAGLAPGDFAAQVAAAAQTLGFPVKTADVAEAVSDGRRAWLERWV